MKRIGITLLTALALSAFASTAQAGEKTISWSPPTHCDSTPPVPIPGELVVPGEGDASDSRIVCTDLVQYRFQCSDTPGAPYDKLTWFKDAPATSDTRDYPPGEYYCRLSVSNDAGFSRWSDQELFFSISLPILEAVPNPPSLIVIEDVGD